MYSVYSSTNKTHYINPSLPAVAQQQGLLKHRVLLLGDAGVSVINPLQASLQKSIERAKLAPEQTSVIMLGDNIYANGFPNKAVGQNKFDAEQIEDISHLEAQLQISKLSNAETFIVPGNHDWYASQVDSQANYIDAYAKRHHTKVSFVPFKANQDPLAEITYRDGISIVFIDTMWLLKADNNTFIKSMHHLEQLLQQSYLLYPDNVILINGHHPIETMGPHGGYYARFGHKMYATALEIVNGENKQDLDSLVYQRLTEGIKLALAPYKKTIFAAGHDHSLQLFKDNNNKAPQYSLVSGAANTKKLTDVGINKNSQFSSSVEGVFEIDILENGVLLRIYDIYNLAPIHEQWLWNNSQ